MHGRRCTLSKSRRIPTTATITRPAHHNRSPTEPPTPRFLTPTPPPTTARKASSDDETAEAPSKPAVPEDLDYYDGLLGQQPDADKAVMGGKDESASTSDYPIPLPSYLLLALATVLSLSLIHI